MQLARLVGTLISAIMLSIVIVGCGTSLDRVTYRDRHYINPDSRSSQLAFLESKVGKFYPTGETVEGRSVYEPKGYNPNSPYVPTVLVLKSSDGKFIIYSLSGGP